MFLRIFILIFMIICAGLNARYTPYKNAAINPFAPYRNNQDRVNGARGGLAQIDYARTQRYGSPNQRHNYSPRERNWYTNTWSNNWSSNRNSWSSADNADDDLPSFWRRPARNRGRRLNRYRGAI